MERKNKGFFARVPKEILTTPGGVVLVIFAIIMEAFDLIPVPFVDQIWETFLEIIYALLFKIITGLSFSSLIIPFLIERIPFLSDILPTWLLRLFF
jgi:hypothetical protein